MSNPLGVGILTLWKVSLVAIGFGLVSWPLVLEDEESSFDCAIRTSAAIFDHRVGSTNCVVPEDVRETQVPIGTIVTLTWTPTEMGAQKLRLEAVLGTAVVFSVEGVSPLRIQVVAQTDRVWAAIPNNGGLLIEQPATMRISTR